MDETAGDGRRYMTCVRPASVSTRATVESMCENETGFICWNRCGDTKGLPVCSRTDASTNWFGLSGISASSEAS
jgi:RNA polymerase subunit RPABC4/transcription elongation factor Spt4